MQKKFRLKMSFLKKIFEESLEEDGLLIMAKGLGLHQILVNFFFNLLM